MRQYLEVIGLIHLWLNINLPKFPRY